MKITIDIPEKIVNIAAATLIAQTDDADVEATVQYAIDSLNEKPFTTDLSELGEDTHRVKLTLAIIAIVQRCGDYLWEMKEQKKQKE